MSIKLRKKPSAIVSTPGGAYVQLFIDEDGLPKIKGSDGAILQLSQSAVITLIEQDSDPTSTASELQLYSKNVDGNTELFALDSSSNAIQITTQGSLAGGGGGGIAFALQTTGGPVGVSGSPPPESGMVLTAMSVATAEWREPSAPLSYGPPTGLEVGGSEVEGGATTVNRSDHQHAMPGVAAPGVSGFFSGTDKTKLDGIAPGADVTLAALASAATAISFNGQIISNVAIPVAANDAANKAYVDAAVEGLDVKAACRLLMATNHPLTGLASIDGVTPVAGDRVLLVGQTNAKQNGIYVAASGAWARSADANQNNEVTSGMYTFIVAGTVYANTGWILTNNDPVNVGGHDLLFAQFSSVGSVAAGDGLTRVGQTLNVTAGPDGSIVVVPDEIRVGVLATDAQHGARGGGTQHAVATGSQAGFISSADWTKLGSLAAGQAATVGRLTVDTILEVPTNVAYAASVTLDAAVKNDYTIDALTGPITITWSNPAAGRQGTVTVRQDATGNRAVTLTAPGGWTLMRDSQLTDLAASQAANSITLYTWSFVSVGGANILLCSKVIAA